MNLPLHRQVLLLFCLLFLSASNAQKPYTSGQFVIKEELGKSDDADEAEYDRLKNNPLLTKQLYNQLTHYVFSDSMDEQRLELQRIFNFRLKR